MTTIDYSTPKSKRKQKSSKQMQPSVVAALKVSTPSFWQVGGRSLTQHLFAANLADIFLLNFIDLFAGGWMRRARQCVIGQASALGFFVV